MQSIALRFERSAAWRYLLFAALTAFTIGFMGYHVGTFDQAVHFPYLKKFVDGSLYPNDPFLDMRLTKYTFFWFPFEWFYQRGVLEVSMFLIHIASTYGTFWALWNLAGTLFHRALASFLAVLIFAFPHMTFGGWTIIEFSLLNRTFVLPFLLLAINYFLQRRYIIAFALVGLMFNLHVIFANFVIAMFALHAVLAWREMALKKIAQGAIAFFAAASPVLLWKASGPTTDFHLRPNELSVVAMAEQANNYYFFAPSIPILIATLSGFSAIALFFILRRNLPTTETHRTMLHFMIAMLIVLAVEVVTAQWLPIEIILELQIIRAGVFTLILSLLYLASYLAESYAARGDRDFNLNLLTAVSIFSFLEVLPLVVWLLERIFAAGRKQWATAVIVVGLNVGAFAYALNLGVWHPGIYIFGRETPWREAQVWARENTPKNAMFIAPPYMWGFYESEWRVFSERPMVAALSDLLQIALSLDSERSWTPRFEDLAPGALAQFRGNFFDNVGITARAFYTLSDADWTRLAEKYGASYLVLEKPHRSAKFPVVYENSQFFIYRLRGTP